MTAVNVNWLVGSIYYGDRFLFTLCSVLLKFIKLRNPGSAWKPPDTYRLLIYFPYIYVKNIIQCNTQQHTHTNKLALQHRKVLYSRRTNRQKHTHTGNYTHKQQNQCFLCLFSPATRCRLRWGRWHHVRQRWQFPGRFIWQPFESQTARRRNSGYVSF